MMARSKDEIYRKKAQIHGEPISLEYNTIFQYSFTSNYYTDNDGEAYKEQMSSGKAAIY
jgi:hypothetical protein